MPTPPVASGSCRVSSGESANQQGTLSTVPDDESTQKKKARRTVGTGATDLVTESAHRGWARSMRTPVEMSVMCYTLDSLRWGASDKGRHMHGGVGW
jgi:hypothetical protein